MKAAEESRYVLVASTRQAGLRRTAYALCGDWHLADDLVQRVLVKLYLAGPLREEGALPAWLTRTMIRVRATFTHDELVAMAGKVTAVKAVAPTRPHPSASDTPPANLLLGPMTGLFDRMRDTITGRGA